MARASACRSSARSRAKEAATGGPSAVAAPLVDAGGEARGESWMERSGEGGAAVEAARRREGARRCGGEGREKETAAVVDVVAAMAAAGRVGGGAEAQAEAEVELCGDWRGRRQRRGVCFLTFWWLVWLFSERI